MTSLPHEITPETQIEHQWERPGIQQQMPEEPVTDMLVDESNVKGPMIPYVGRDMLKDKVALITGGDSGIGASVAYMFAAEGCDVAINYLISEQEDADKVRIKVEGQGRKCLMIPANIGYEHNCRMIVDRVIEEFGKLDILVNNAGEQHMVEHLEDLTGSQMVRTFRTNIFGPIMLTKHALGHLKHGATIINTTSVVAFRGSQELIDYASTKGALVAFTRSLAKQLMSRGIRVNCVAPGPTLTPLQSISRDRSNMDEFANGDDKPQGRISQPSEIATSFVFLASNWSSAMTGQTLHPNAWEIYNT